MNLPIHLDTLSVGAKSLQFSIIKGKVSSVTHTLSETMKVEIDQKFETLTGFEFPDTAPLGKGDEIVVVMVSIDRKPSSPLSVINLSLGKERALDQNHIQQLQLVNKRKVYFFSLLIPLAVIYFLCGSVLLFVFWDSLKNNLNQIKPLEVLGSMIAIAAAFMTRPKFWHAVDEQYKKRLATAYSKVTERREAISEWIKQNHLHFLA